MSDSEPSRVFNCKNTDPEMQRAYEEARQTFRYFWREVAWERRRIVPALDVACVKAPFTDSEQGLEGEEDVEVEVMWLGEVDFDGQFVRGRLLNAPNKLKSVRQHDWLQIPLRQICDWIYVIGGEVYGAFTVNLIRSRLDPQNLQEHDTAWGLNFGDPNSIRITPEQDQRGGQGIRLAMTEPADTDEHPLSKGMAEKLEKQLKTTPSMIDETDDRGWTLLHQESLAGNLDTVKVLLDAGADPYATTDQMQTPLDLAKSLGWDNVISLLSAYQSPS